MLKEGKNSLQNVLLWTKWLFWRKILKTSKENKHVWIYVGFI